MSNKIYILWKHKLPYCGLEAQLFQCQWCNGSRLLNPSLMLLFLMLQFKRLLNRELKDFSDANKSGNQVSAWVYNTFTGRDSCIVRRLFGRRSQGKTFRDFNSWDTLTEFPSVVWYYSFSFSLPLFLSLPSSLVWFLLTSYIHMVTSSVESVRC